MYDTCSISLKEKLKLFCSLAVDIKANMVRTILMIILVLNSYYVSLTHILLNKTLVITVYFKRKIVVYKTGIYR